MTILEQLPVGCRAAVIRLRSLGECVLTTPALALLKKTRPDISIGVAVEDRFRPVFEGNPNIGALLAPTWQAVRGWKPALCVNLQGGARSQWMTALSGAKWRAGFSHHNITFAYNLKIGRAQRILGVNRTVHTVEHYASAFFALGVPLQPPPRAQLIAANSPISGRYALLHLFGSTPDRQWPAERFCEIARYLALWNITPVFLAKAADDVAAFMPHRVFQSDLACLKAVVSKAAVFVGNDSGPSQVAAAFGIPSVVFFDGSNPALWSPWRTDSEVVVAPDGLANISVSRVIAALERLRVFEEAHA